MVKPQSINSNISRLCVGTAAVIKGYGITNKVGPLNSSKIKKIFNICDINKIRFIDTAQAYGDAEKKIGKFTSDKFKIITKVQLQDNSSLMDIKNIESKFINSLNHLQKEKIYGLLIHNVDHLYQKNGEKIYDELQNLKRQKLVSKIGISIYDPKSFRDLNKFYDFDIVQLPYNIFDNSYVSSGLNTQLRKKKIEVFLRSIFLQGLLLLPKNKLPKKFVKWKKHFMKYQNWLIDSNITPLEANVLNAIKLSKKEKIVIGVNSSNELQDIISIINQNKEITDINQFTINDEMLINPTNWSKL